MTRTDSKAALWAGTQAYENCDSKSCGVTVGAVNRAARCRTWRFTIRNFAASGQDSELNLITLCGKCHATAHGT